ncbi:glycosyltransferase [Vibrio fortis]|uniref:glycosyltransferase n=1 Tax=Vibrio fortis TaxID=212667 RepID=UPI004068FD48
MEKLKCKTLYLCNSLSDGGGEKVFSYLYSEFKGLFVFSTIYDTCDFIGRPNRVINLTKKGEFFARFRSCVLLLALFRYFFLILKYKPKSVVSHLHLSNLFNVVGGKLFNYDSHIVLHGFLSAYLQSNSIFKRGYGRALVFAYKHATSVVAISEGLSCELNKLDIDNRVIYNPVAPYLSTDDNSVLNLERSKFNMIVIARLTEIKRVEDILDAISNIHSVNLYIVGEGPLKRKLAIKTQELEIENRVFFLGFIKNAGRLISQFDCLVSASEIETFGLTLLEGLLSGTPIISSNCDSGPREILNVTCVNGDGVISVPGKGLLYDVGNIEQLEICINEIIKTDVYKPTKIVMEDLLVKYSLDRFFDSYRKLV